MNAYTYIFSAITKLVSGAAPIVSFSIIGLAVSTIAVVVIALQEKDTWVYKPTIKHIG